MLSTDTTHDTTIVYCLNKQQQKNFKWQMEHTSEKYALYMVSTRWNDSVKVEVISLSQYYTILYLGKSKIFH